MLPSLLELSEHPAALEFLPEAIARAANQPWASQREALFTTVSTDISEGVNCVTHPPHQVDAAHQRWTDAAA